MKKSILALFIFSNLVNSAGFDILEEKYKLAKNTLLKVKAI